MATKREAPVKKASKRKTAAPASEERDDTGTVGLVSAPSATIAPIKIDPDVRRGLVAAEAYFSAERRGFATGHELEDWAAAEVAVDTRLHQMQTS